MAASSPIRLAFATLVVGVAAGAAGLALTALFDVVQHLAAGSPAALAVGPAAPLDGYLGSGPARRVVVLVICGLVAGSGWWLLDRRRRRVAIADALAADDPRLPVTTALVHVVLQVVTVALGSPLGREVAPREASATFASWFCERVGLTRDERRLLIACAAGAGLAAVYDVPLGGALFTLEVLLSTVDRGAVVAALATSVVAASIPWVVLGDASQYRVPAWPVDASLIAWSVVVGPLLGLVAKGFRALGGAAEKAARLVDRRGALLALAVFAAIGALSVPLPQILGNGKVPAQLAFDGALVASAALTLLVVKGLVVMAALRAGAHGGLLTPALSCGALLAVALGAAWSAWWPGPAPGAYALVGATAFLSTSMAMPLTAIVLVFELTRVSHDFVVPIVCAVGGSVATGTWSKRALERRRPVP